MPVKRCGNEKMANDSSCVSAKYELTFYNDMTKDMFSFIPDDGLVFSPIVSAGHNGKFSILTFRGYASDAVRAVAETGDNSKVVGLAKANSELVKSYDTADAVTMSGNSTKLDLTVDCNNTFVTALSMGTSPYY